MIQLITLAGDQLTQQLAGLAQLRIQVFRAYPYLYAGDADYEAWYLAEFAKAKGAVVIGAFDGDQLIGAASAAPMVEQKSEFSAPLIAAGIDISEMFYFGESVLLPNYRGQGLGHGFFDAREAAARAQGFRHAGFYAVIRASDDARKPDDYSPLDGFWRKRGYCKLENAIAQFPWMEIDSTIEIPHAMQFWHRQI